MLRYHFIRKSESNTKHMMDWGLNYPFNIPKEYNMIMSASTSNHRQISNLNRRLIRHGHGRYMVSY